MIPPSRPHDYQKLALCTAPDFGPRVISPENDQVLHGAVGLCSELSEIRSANENNNLAEEIGDALWYIAVGLHGAGYDLEDFEYESINVVDAFEEIVDHSSIIIDQAKRLIFYGAPLDHRYIQSHRHVLKCLSEMADQTKFSMIGIMQRNIEKLRIRFPDKYTNERAIQRDTNKESKAFE